MVEGQRVVRAEKWEDLPEVLEPGVYYVNHERIVVKERVSRESLKRALSIMKERGGRYV